jgi:hypothetical protein
MAAIVTTKLNNAVRLKSFIGDEWYNISLDQRTCDCPDFQKILAPCKHLNALGIYSQPKPFVAKTHPTFSQALSGLVKSIRIRMVEDAVYWLVYLDGFANEKRERYRTARRLLIGSAEDGLSIAAMERVVENFSKLYKKDTDLVHLAEADRSTLDIDTASFESLEVPLLPEPAMTLEQIDAIMRDGRAVPKEMEWKPLDPRSYSLRMPGMATASRVTTDADVFEYSGENHQLFSPGGQLFAAVQSVGRGESEAVEGDGICWMTTPTDGSVPQFFLSTKFGIEEIKTLAECKRESKHTVDG